MSRKKIVSLLIGLAVFALLGTGVFYAAGFNKPSRPELSKGFRFYKGISVAQLNFSDAEVRKLNGTLRRNKKVVEKAILTISDSSEDLYSENISSNAELTFSIKLKGRNGMVFTPENVFCARKKLVNQIAANLNTGAKVLAEYSEKSIFKNKEVTIIDM